MFSWDERVCQEGGVLECSRSFCSELYGSLEPWLFGLELLSFFTRTRSEVFERTFTFLEDSSEFFKQWKKKWSVSELGLVWAEGWEVGRLGKLFQLGVSRFFIPEEVFFINKGQTFGVHFYDEVISNQDGQTMRSWTGGNVIPMACGGGERRKNGCVSWSGIGLGVGNWISLQPPVSV